MRSDSRLRALYLLLPVLAVLVAAPPLHGTTVEVVVAVDIEQAGNELRSTGNAKNVILETNQRFDLAGVRGTHSIGQLVEHDFDVTPEYLATLRAFNAVVGDCYRGNISASGYNWPGSTYS